MTRGAGSTGPAVTAGGWNTAPYYAVPFGGPGAGPPAASGTTRPPGLKAAIVTALAAHPPTVALIGHNLFPVMVPQTVNLAGGPALTYQFVSSLHDYNLQTAAGMRETRVRFTIYSYTHADLETCLELLRNYFVGYKWTLGGLPLCFATLENENDGYDEPLAGTDLGTHYKEFDFLFKLREAIPTNT